LIWLVCKFNRNETGSVKIIRNNTVKKGSSYIDKAFYPPYFVSKSNTMKLVMYLGNDLIESVPVEPGGLSKPGYLGNFKRVLKLKYKTLLSQVPEPPEFYVIDPAPRQTTART
jgi:hypothetical protein